MGESVRLVYGDCTGKFYARPPKLFASSLKKLYETGIFRTAEPDRLEALGFDWSLISERLSGKKLYENIAPVNIQK